MKTTQLVGSLVIGLGVLCTPGALAENAGGTEPVVAGPAVNDESCYRVDYVASPDLEMWINRAFVDGPLYSYHGSRQDHRAIAEHLVRSQFLPNRPDVGGDDPSGDTGDGTRPRTFINSRTRTESISPSPTSRSGVRSVTNSRSKDDSSKRDRRRQQRRNSRDAGGDVAYAIERTPETVDPMVALEEALPRAGAWKADLSDWETFDEGTQGMGIAVLALMIDRYGDDWIFDHPAAGPRRMSEALDSALRCVYRNQYTEDDPGIPGPWPQAPGWREGESHYDFSGLRTFNDGVTSEIVRALLVVRAVLGTDEGRIDETILRCGEGCWEIQERNGFGVPEQCDENGNPMWARGHEPPSLSPRSTAYVGEIYLACHAISGSDVWLYRMNMVYEWLDDVEINNSNTWEHFLEPGTLRPIWGDSYYHLVYDRNSATWPSNPHGTLETHPMRVQERIFWYQEGILPNPPQ